MSKLAIKTSCHKCTKRRASGGQGLLEFAVVMSLFTVLVLGIIELGHAFYAYVALSSAAREGARLAIVDPNDTLVIQDKVVSSAHLSSLQRSDVTILVPGSRELQVTGVPVTVTISYVYHPLINLVLP